jgi:pyrimidine operon attenuation protein/uracil phosphoribosyltransferase
MANDPPSEERLGSTPEADPGADSTASGASLAAGASASGDAPGEASVVLNDLAIRRALMRIAHEIVERNDDLGSLYLVGVPNGGVPLARVIAQNLAQIVDLEPVVGVLDTTLYRDDLISSGSRPQLRRTEMPSAVDDRVVVLVDDVASTGRTIRAAMDALMDFGRPRAVQVVALVDRGHRELPIKIDYVGKNIPTQRSDLVKFRAEGDDLDAPMQVVLLRGEGDGA